MTETRTPVTHPFRFDGLRVVVTGGATGVGAALLDQLAALGPESVTVIDIARPTGPHAAYVEADLSARDQVHAAAAAVEGRVDVLVNNAGVADTMPPATVFAVNFLAVRELTSLLVDRMPTGGSVVITASIAGSQWAERLGPIRELLAIESWDEAAAWFAARDDLGAPYYFTKECLHVYTTHSAREFGRRGLRINCVSPAPVDTPLLADFRKTMSDTLIDWSVAEGDGRLVTAAEVAGALAFLASPAARGLNGLDIAVDHGFGAALGAEQVDFSALLS